MSTPSEPVLRPAVRALMIDPQDRIALVKLHWAATGWTGWVLPGGGIEDGETHAEALRRELAEETGAPEVFIGPPVLMRRHRIPGIIDGYDGQEETVYLVPTHAFDLAPGLSPEQLAAENAFDVRWWTAAEIAATDEVVQPEGLSDLLAHVLEFGAPDPVWRIDIDD